MSWESARPRCCATRTKGSRVRDGQERKRRIDATICRMKRVIASALLLLLACAAGFAAGRGTAGLHPAGDLGVARIWHGRTTNAKADEYAQYLYEGGIQKMRSRPSNLGVQVFRKTDGGFTDFLVVSYWPSRDSVREWAGAEIDRTR